jgi:diacylglycerol O-acyltransferase / wax synthase
MIERLTGTDATLWHLERPDVSPHTLKTVILDPSGLQRQLTLKDIRDAFQPRLGLIPRATQVVRAARYFPGRPFWVPDPNFNLDQHLEEVTLPAPGDRSQLDALHAELVIRPMPRDRPLWVATLVHGLADGQQALVVRVHHAIADGLGALNTFLRLTTDDPARAVPTAPKPRSVFVSAGQLRQYALRQAPATVTALAPLARDAVASYRRARQFRHDHPDLPAMLGAPRNFTSRGASPQRVCASYDLDFARLRAVAKASGVTVNGAFHALIAAAMRDQLLAHGDDVEHPTVASFAVAGDPSDRDRVHGNLVTPTVVRIFSNIAEPIQRLRETARSCRDGVELRKLTGVQMAARWSDYTCRLAPLFMLKMADRSPRVVNHVTTANVPGPSTIRYAGPVAIVNWISLVFTVHPSNLNITAYSYAGRMSIGLVTTPRVLPEPRQFLERMDAELEILYRALVSKDSPDTTTAPSSSSRA